MLYEKNNWGQVINAKDIHPYLLTALHNLGIPEHRAKVMSETKKLLEANDDHLERRGATGKLLLDMYIIHSMSRMCRTNYTEFDSRQKGFWQLSGKGEQEVATLLKAENKVEAANNLRKKIEASNKEYKKSKKRDANQKDEEPDAEIAAEEPDAETAAMEKDLETVKSMNPFAFERLCVGLLRKMGGQEMEVTQRTNDGGIDGVGYIEVGFIRFKIVMQAKRYKDSTITAKQITNFLGAIQRFRAEKSVFITTTDFNSKARELAKENSITLISGMGLIGLMKKHNVGYSTDLRLEAI